MGKILHNHAKISNYIKVFMTHQIKCVYSYVNFETLEFEIRR